MTPMSLFFNLASSLTLGIVIKFAAISVKQFFWQYGLQFEGIFVTEFFPSFINKKATAKNLYFV
jgi:hypothetical protein